MQNSETMTTRYIMTPRLRCTRELGSYVSYDIAAWDCQLENVSAVVPDATADRELALKMCEAFNRNQLSPCHLRDAVCDMLP